MNPFFLIFLLIAWYEATITFMSSLRARYVLGIIDKETPEIEKFLRRPMLSIFLAAITIGWFWPITYTLDICSEYRSLQIAKKVAKTKNN